MKNAFIFISFAMITATSFGQGIWDINFEDTSTIHRVIIDTISNPNNRWQVGHPNKTILNSSFSYPNVIITDTITSYPPNDTSSFTIIHLAEMGWTSGYPKVDIGGWYYVNSDSLTDYGYIEFSSNQGSSWIRADSSRGVCTWGAVEDLPTFTGNSFGWKRFYYCLQVPTVVNFGDTILYRFTFISDSTQTNKDGLMFDDLHFEDWAEGISNFHNDNLISIYPNPVTDKLIIERPSMTTNDEIQILNFLGQIIFSDSKFNGESIDLQQQNNGIYFLKYSNTKYFSVKKFIIQH